MGTENICIGCMKLKSDCSCGYTEGNQKHRTALPERTVLKGKYLIGKVLGEPGGFGVTYIGYNMHLEKRVAIKEYYPQSLVSRGNDSLTVHSNKTGKDQDKSYGLKKFLEEAKILAKFNHPNIVKVYDYFEANNTGYIVMEYYEGETLEEYIKKRGKMKEKLVKELMVPVLDGLREVHKGNYLHRDIKPENIYLTREGIPKLIDFGAAREDFEEKTKSVMLTPGYAPYEQYSENLPQGTYTDIYGVSATIYKMLTGKKPQAAPDRMAEDNLKELKDLVEVSDGLNRAVMKGLAVKRKDRYQDIELFQSEIIKGVYNRKKRCPKCGNIIKKDLGFCVYCSKETNKVTDKEKKTRNIFIGVGIASLLFMGLLIFWNTETKDVVKAERTPNKIETISSKDFYETIGMGAPSKKSTNVVAQRQTSYEAAKAAALNDLAGYLYGVKLESGIEVKDAIAQNSSIKTEIATFIRDAEIVNREWDDSYTCTITMRINIKEFKEKLKKLGIE